MNQQPVVEKDQVGAHPISGAAFEIAKDVFTPDSCCLDVIVQALAEYDHVVVP